MEKAGIWPVTTARSIPAGRRQEGGPLSPQSMEESRQSCRLRGSAPAEATNSWCEQKQPDFVCVSVSLFFPFFFFFFFS